MTEVGEEDDLRERDLDAVRHEHGDIMMFDDWSSNEKYIDMYIIMGMIFSIMCSDFVKKIKHLVGSEVLFCFPLLCWNIRYICYVYTPTLNCCMEIESKLNLRELLITDLHPPELNVESDVYTPWEDPIHLPQIYSLADMMTKMMHKKGTYILCGTKFYHLGVIYPRLLGIKFHIWSSNSHVMT